MDWWKNINNILFPSFFSFEEHKYNIIRTSTLLVHTRAAVSSGGNLEPFVLNPISVEEERRKEGMEGEEEKEKEKADQLPIHKCQ